MNRRQALQRLMTSATAAAATAAATFGARAAVAQDYPTRPITWVCPYLAGTAPDSTVRVLAQAMSGILGQPVVVENKPGAAGNLGARIVAHAAPDGYTWIYSASTMAASMKMYRRPGFDVFKDFQHVGRISTSDLVLVTRPDDARFPNLTALIDWGRAHPGALTYASGGVGTPAHLGAELLLHATQVQALHVPYKGASDSVNAVLGHQVDFALTITTVSAPLVSAGRLRALATTGGTPNPRLPNVPTLAQAGVPDVRLESFGGLSLPAGTPPAIVSRVSQALADALAQPQVREHLQADGGTVAPLGASAFVDEMHREIAQTQRLMQIAGLQPQ